MNEHEKDMVRPHPQSSIDDDETVGCMVCGEPIPDEKDRRMDGDNVVCTDCHDALYEYKEGD